MTTLTPPCQQLVRIPELMTHVLDFLGDVELFGIFSAEQLEIIWQMLSSKRQKDVFHEMFFDRIDLGQRSIYHDKFVDTVPQRITFFRFFNRNWRKLIESYFMRTDDGMLRIMPTPAPFPPITRLYRPLLVIREKDFPEHVSWTVNNFMMNVIHSTILMPPEHGLTVEDSILFLSFLRSNPEVLRTHNGSFSKHRFYRFGVYGLLLTVRTHLTQLVSVPRFDRNRFQFLVDLIKWFSDSGVRVKNYPILYYDRVTMEHMEDMKSFLKENASIVATSAKEQAKKKVFILRVCHVTSKSDAASAYSRLLWNYGCRCDAHVDIISHEIAARKPIRMTADKFFAAGKKIAALCKMVTDTAQTPVGSAIYNELFKAGCQCGNHTSSPIH